MNWNDGRIKPLKGSRNGIEEPKKSPVLLIIIVLGFLGGAVGLALYIRNVMEKDKIEQENKRAQKKSSKQKFKMPDPIIEIIDSPLRSQESTDTDITIISKEISGANLAKDEKGEEARK